jgi:co-chaperonin GroES (HSP10)
MTNISPLRDRIAVLPDKWRDDVTPMGILVPANEKIGTSQQQLGRAGTVAAIGPDVDPDQLPVGSRILFGEWEYTELHAGGQRYLVMQDKDIVGVIED